jgi:MFS transporter, PPP family, 3-phenylpropionic acid transporter
MVDSFAFRMSLFYGAFFLYGGLSLPFMPAWLATRELDAREIGIVLAAPMVVRIIVVPLSTRLADRVAGLRPALGATAVASVAGFVLVGLSSHFIPVLAAYTLAAIALAPVQPLGDAYALRGLRDRMRSYGSVRLWGSVTFIVANLGGGVLLAWLGAANVIWAVTAALALNAVAALTLTPLTPEAVEPASQRRTRASLWRSPTFAAVMLGASLIQASHAVMYGFGTLQWSARGIGGTAIGMLWALGVVAEIVLFALSARVVGAVGATGMIVLGGAGGALRWAAMAFDPPTVLLPLLQLLHALSFGATHLGSMHVLARVAPVGRNATAQGDFVAVQGIVFAAAMSGSGVLVAWLGSLAYGAMAVIAAAGGLLAAVALSRERRAPAA